MNLCFASPGHRLGHPFLVGGGRLGLGTCGLLAAAVFLLSPPAGSCGVCFCEAPVGLRPAGWGQTRPLDTRLLVGLSYIDLSGATVALGPGDIHWTNASTGVPVEFEVIETGGAGREVWVVPRTTLPEGNAFEVWAGSADDPVFRYEFTAVSSSSSTGLTGGQPIVEPVGPSSVCGDFEGIRLSWADLREGGVTPSYDPIARVQVTQGVQAATLFLGAGPHQDGNSLVLAAPLDGQGRTCWSSSAIPFPVTGEMLEVQVTLFDQAGRPTEFSPVDVALEGNPGAFCPAGEGGCSLASSGASQTRGLGACLLVWFLAAVGARRRAGRFTLLGG